MPSPGRALAHPRRVRGSPLRGSSGLAWAGSSPATRRKPSRGQVCVQAPLARRRPADAGFDIVAVGVEDKGAVIIASAFARTGWAKIPATRCQRSPVEFVDDGFARSREGDVGLVDAGARAF